MSFHFLISLFSPFLSAHHQYYVYPILHLSSLSIFLITKFFFSLSFHSFTYSALHLSFSFSLSFSFVYAATVLSISLIPFPLSPDLPLLFFSLPARSPSSFSLSSHRPATPMSSSALTLLPFLLSSLLPSPPALSSFQRTACPCISSAVPFSFTSLPFHSSPTTLFSLIFLSLPLLPPISRSAFPSPRLPLSAHRPCSPNVMSGENKFGFTT